MSEPESETPQVPGSPLSRRTLFKGLTLLPLAATGLSACGDATTAPGGAANTVAAPAANASDPASATPPAAAAGGGPYTPTFLKPDEWTFIVAACDRLIPHDEHGPGAVESGVPEFIDRHMQTPYAAGDIWYMQGPFIEASADFGYQGRLTIREILRVGMHALDTHCRSSFGGKTFAQLEHPQQETLLKGAESGELHLPDIASKLFFAQLLSEVRNGYFADPAHGGNKGMGSWKMIGYPGMRADYSDWVEVRDKPYSLPPVDLFGRRG
jgi:gluconate 2-dehydrogenase gamma chain